MDIAFETGRDEPGRYLMDIFQAGTDEMIGNGQIVGGRAMGSRDWTWVVNDLDGDWLREGTAGTMAKAEAEIIRVAKEHWAWWANKIEFLDFPAEGQWQTWDGRDEQSVWDGDTTSPRTLRWRRIA